MKRTILILLCFIPLVVSAKVSTRLVLDTKGPLWGFDFNKSEVFLSLKEGTIQIYNLKTKKSKKYKIPNVTVRGQGGLLDLHYKKIGKERYLYYTFALKVGDVVTTALGRSLLSEGSLINHKVLFKAKVVSDTSRHFGSRLAFVDSSIFMSIGDRGERDYAQNLSYHNGKILRLGLEGKAYNDNPFVGKEGALPEIWSYGHRNPQGLFYDEKTGSLYSSEFGPRGGDELNIIKKGRNYGWPVITYGSEYWGPSIGKEKKKGMEQPLVYWTPSISPSGLAIYTGDKNPKWKGSFFLACLGSTHLRRVVLKDNKSIQQEELLSELNERIRHVKTSPKGELYISTDSGKLLTVHQ